MSAAISLYGVASASDAGVSCDDMNGFNFGFEIGASVANSQIDTEDNIGASQLWGAYSRNPEINTAYVDVTESTAKNNLQSYADTKHTELNGCKDTQAAHALAATKKGTGDYPMMKYYAASHTKYSKKSQNSIKGNFGVNVAYGLNETTAVGLHLGVVAGAKTRNTAQRASDLGVTGYTTEVSELGGVSFEALLTLQQKINDMFVLAGAGINIAEVKSQVEMYLDQFRRCVTISTKNKKPAAKLMLGIKKPITQNSSMVYKLAYTFGKKKTSALGVQRVSAPCDVMYAVDSGTGNAVLPGDTHPADHTVTIDNGLGCIIDPCQHKMKTKGAFDFTIAYEVNLH